MKTTKGVFEEEFKGEYINHIDNILYINWDDIDLNSDNLFECKSENSLIIKDGEYRDGYRQKYIRCIDSVFYYSEGLEGEKPANVFVYKDNDNYTMYFRYNQDDYFSVDKKILENTTIYTISRNYLKLMEVEYEKNKISNEYSLIKKVIFNKNTSFDEGSVVYRGSDRDDVFKVNIFLDDFTIEYEKQILKIFLLSINQKYGKKNEYKNIEIPKDY